ncbi:MAG: phosphoribosyltransferase family protein [Acidimicrobiales bacterium]|jgi:predicted amidophosphoribosyltransferase
MRAPPGPGAPATYYGLCTSCGQPAYRASAPGGGGVTATPVCRNSWCGRPGRPLGAVYAVGSYDGALRKAIVSYKYSGDLRWARTFARLLHGFLRRHATWFEEFGVVCPVPTFLGPGAHRSWGHVELICAELAWSAGGEWPVESLVAKVAETEPMSAKGWPRRRQIARQLATGAFVVPVPADVDGRRVLVVDDVCASGETLLSAGEALRRAGAAEVSAVVLARARWRPGGPRLW